MKLKQNIPLIVGISIPILMIVFVAGSIYLPGLFVKPKYDFLYSHADSYYYGNMYSVSEGKILKHTSTEPNRYQLPQGGPKILYYDVALNKSRDVSFEEAEKFKLDPNQISPDGFEIQSGRRNGGIFPFFFFDGYDYNSKYIVGHGFSKKLNLSSSNLYYYGNFKLLGWVLK